MKRWWPHLWKGVALLAVVLATLVVCAPAAWLGDYLARSGRLRLIDAQGTLWSGSGILAVSDGRAAHPIPGRLHWRLDFLPLLTGKVSAHLRLPLFEAALDLTLARGAASIAPGRATAPASALASLGMPFNTVQPGGVLRLRWDDMRASAGKYTGEVNIDWLDAQSVLSKVAPLGNFRVAIKAQGESARVSLATLKGPLQLEGEGLISECGVRFTGTASAEATMRPALNTLIGILGPREGDKVLLRINALRNTTKSNGRNDCLAAITL